MKYLYYKKNGTMLFIKNNNDNINYNYIEINETKELEIINWLNENDKNLVKVLNSSICLLVNELSKRADIVKERDTLLDVAGRFIDRPTYTDKLGLTSQDIDDVTEYYERLLDMPQHYDLSTDKQTWSYVFVEVYTSGKNTNSYQLFKPEFIK